MIDKKIGHASQVETFEAIHKKLDKALKILRGLDIDIANIKHSTMQYGPVEGYISSRLKVQRQLQRVKREAEQRIDSL